MNIAVLEIAGRVRLTVLANNNILLSRNLNPDNFLNEAYSVLVPLSIHELKVVLFPTLLGEKPEGDVLISVLKLGSSTRYLSVSKNDVDKVKELGQLIGAETLRVTTTTDVARMYSKYKPYIVAYEGLNHGYFFLATKDCEVLQHSFNLTLNEDYIQSLMDITDIREIISYYNNLFISELGLDYLNVSDMNKEEQKLITPALTVATSNIGFTIKLREENIDINEPEIFTSDIPDLAALDEFKDLSLKPEGSEELPANETEGDLDLTLDEIIADQVGDSEEPNEFDKDINLFEDADEDKGIEEPKEDESLDVLEEEEPKKSPKKKDTVGGFLTAIGCAVVILASASVFINKYIPNETTYLQQKQQQVQQLVKPLETSSNYYENYAKALAKGQNYDTPIFKEISAVKINGVVLEAKTENNNIDVKVFLANPKDIKNVEQEFNKLFNVTNISAGNAETMDGHTLTPFDISGTLRNV